MRIAPRIVATADTCGGHPRIEGTRVRVAHVIGWLAAGMTEDEIIADYGLSQADIRAALAYAAAQIEGVAVAAE